MFCVCLCVSEPPSAPKNLCVTKTEPSSVTLEWKNPKANGKSPPTTYVIEAKSDRQKGYDVIARVSSEATTYKATGLEEGQKYMFKVKSENQYGLSEKAAKLKEAILIQEAANEGKRVVL